MNREDIIRMAREAGMLPVHFNRTSFETELSVYPKELERFAQLVATHVRSPEWLARRTNAAIAAEREACAQVCDELHDTFYDEDNSGRCAEAIRARGQQ